MKTCKLCLRQYPKLAKAHILPKRFYDDLIADQSNRALLVTPQERTKRSRTGVYDKELLCEVCERTLMSQDDYAAKAFFEVSRRQAFYHEGQHLAEYIEILDTFRLRGFFLTLVWRMASTSSKMFAGMRVGPYAERTRLAVLEKAYERLPEFDVVLSRFTDDEHGGFLGPTRLRIGGVNGFRVHFPRHVCWVKLDKRSTPSPFNALSLSAAPPLYILLREFDGSPERRAMGEVMSEHRRVWGHSH